MQHPTAKLEDDPPVCHTPLKLTARATGSRRPLGQLAGCKITLVPVTSQASCVLGSACSSQLVTSLSLGSQQGRGDTHSTHERQPRTNIDDCGDDAEFSCL